VCKRSERQELTDLRFGSSPAYVVFLRSGSPDVLRCPVRTRQCSPHCVAIRRVHGTKSGIDLRCQTCQTENSQKARFCMQCGTSMMSAQEKGPAERRQLTVLFCDLVGSTALSEEIDPEDLRDVIRQYHATSEGVVERYGGSIAQHLGDGVLVYFGHPRAHEDDPVRAVRAGLALRDAVSTLRVRDRPLAVRVGIHTGVVVVGSIGAEARQLALGATPNLAARIQQDAQPGTVQISEATHRLTSGFFDFYDLGLRSARGVSQPVRLYRVERETGARSRMEATAASLLTPFVGREEELVTLLERWGDALGGKAPVVMLCGEPGIGKSRLVRALREQVGADALIMECFASPLFQDTALYPVVEMLEREFGTAKEAPDSRRAKLRAQLERANVATPATTGPIEALLSIARPEESSMANLSPQKQRMATFDALATWLRAAAEKQPVLFVLEDLHWADPSTIELAGLLIERVSTGMLMTVLIHRPEFVPPFVSPRLALLTLERMPQDQAHKILAALSGDRQLPEAVEREVLAKADGIPLYVEEIAKAVLESRESEAQEVPSGPVSSRAGFAIPATVVDSLTARLDRLGEGKRVVQLAATLGRTFTLGLLLDVAGMQEAALRAELDRLQVAGLVTRRDASPEETYIFKHALIKDAAYDSLLRGTRQEYHRQIARVLEERFPNIATSQPELLARHLAGAGMAVEAVKYWALAGQKAFTRSANIEAISAYGNALNLLSSLPSSEKRDRQEIELRCGLGLALISAKGWSAKEVEETYAPAHDHCRRYGDVPLRVLYGLWAVAITRADRARTAELVPRFERLLKQTTDRQELLMTHSMLAGRAFWSAEYAAALQHSDAGAAYVDRENPRNQALDLFAQGYDGQLYPSIFRSWTDIIQARKRSAIAVSQESVDMGLVSGNPYLLALALSCGAAVAHDMRDVALVEARGQQLSELARDNAFAFFSGNSLAFLGWVAFKKGDLTRGLDLLDQAANFHVALGADMVSAYYLSWLAEACLVARRVDEGLAALDRGLQITEKTLSVFCEPELHRLKGELLWSKGDVAEAERSLRTARTIASSRGATLFEARASLSLGRLWAAQGRRAEAIPMLRASYQGIPIEEPLSELQDLRELGQQLGCAL
jgi:class 3 adenylate cyclase/tetratricopeptide (TPR) repeat protein